MANLLFDAAKVAILKGLIDWPAADIRVVLIDDGLWTPNATTDQDLADVPAGARVATSASLAGKAVLATGRVDADDITLTNVSGSVFEGILIYLHTGTEATATLIVYLDTGVAGLPGTPDGGDQTVRWPAAGIFGF